MNENILALFRKVAESEELQSRFAKAGTPEEAYEAAKEIQDGFTKEEFLEAAKALAEAMDEDISDEDLADAAGGLDEPAEAVQAETLNSAGKLTQDIDLEAASVPKNLNKGFSKNVSKSLSPHIPVPRQVSPKVSKSMAV